MTRVVKIGGRAQGDPSLPAAIAAAQRGGRLCVVHGGGDEVSELQRALGQAPRFVNGRRATTPEELGVVRMVLSGTVNKRLVSQFTDAGVDAVGLSGEDGDILRCVEFGGGSLGVVGTPSRVRPAALEALMDRGFVPVISPVGRFEKGGGGCNVNGDDAAAAIAAALNAAELLLVADVPGVLDDRGDLIARLDPSEAAALIQSGVARGGMIAKLEAALRSLELGALRVRIGGIPAIADLTIGTSIVVAPTGAVSP
ncbi:MAG: acetylglutamate kinase [Gemmatimonadaceae bacterium]|nr:acetylglutamate kinase [Gemmatimonadaceae bacterium]